MNLERRLLNEQGGAGHRGPELPACDVPSRPLGELLPGARLRAGLAFPQVSEPEVVRQELPVLWGLFCREESVKAPLQEVKVD